MAHFIGTKKEFNRYIGPILRNIVQQIIRKYRIKKGKYEHCSSKDNLEAAHTHGNDRLSIIDKILTNYKSDELYNVDLIEFETKFKTEHEAIENVNNSHRLFSNLQIQQRLIKTLEKMEDVEIEKFCSKAYSKTIFDINFCL